MNGSAFLWGAFWTVVGVRVLTAWVEHRLLYRRRRELHTLPADVGLEAEDVDFCATDGCLLHGWWFEHADARGVMVICHGNAGNISDRLWMAQSLAELPVHLLIFDYRGFGRSRGIPRESGTERDVRAAVELARQKWKGEGEAPIVLLGRSLGGAVALQAADEPGVRALILESTFTSVLELGERFYPWLLPRISCLNRYRSDVRIRNAEVPVLLAHSPEDEVVPYDMGETLYSLAPHPWRFVRMNGLHDEAGWLSCPAYAAAIRELVTGILPRSASRAADRCICG